MKAKADLLASAIRILKDEQHPFTIKPWRELMPRALADTKKAAMKEAGKKIAKPPKHVPGLLTSTEPKLQSNRPLVFPEKVFNTLPIDRSAFPKNPYPQGVDTGTTRVVQSNQDVNSDAPTTEGIKMTETTTTPTKQEADAAAAQAKIKAKADKAAAAEQAKADKAAAKLKADAEKAAKADAKKAELLAAKTKKDEERAAAKAAKAAAPKTPRERTYEGSMLALSERVASGVYSKGVNGQLRSNDEVAIALESVPAKRMVTLLMEILAIPTNPYPHLNYGQQSMNLRNRLRGAIKSGAEVEVNGTKVKVTLDRVKEVRDAGNYTAEPAEPAKSTPEAPAANAAA